MARPPVVDVEPMLDRFRLGFDALRDVWAWIVAPRTLLQLKALAEARAPQFRFGNELWTQVVYDFALAYRARSMPHDHLLGALTPAGRRSSRRPAAMSEVSGTVGRSIRSEEAAPLPAGARRFRPRRASSLLVEEARHVQL
jgi:hypothetical protein